MRPDLLVDLRRIPNLRGIDADAHSLRIGPLVTFAEAAASSELRSACPLVVEAIRHVGSPAIRNRGTLAGNLVWADPASELPSWRSLYGLFSPCDTGTACGRSRRRISSSAPSKPRSGPARS